MKRGTKILVTFFLVIALSVFVISCSACSLLAQILDGNHNDSSIQDGGTSSNSTNNPNNNTGGNTGSNSDTTPESNKLVQEGYVFDSNNDWYEKDGELQDDGTVVEGTIINFTQSDKDINRTYVINDNQNRVVFIGNSATVYTRFNIIVSGRFAPVYIELKNFKFEAPTGKAGIDASDVNPDFTVYVIVSGTSSIRGGDGNNGQNGTGYKITTAASNPRNGEKGEDGQNGFAAITGNTIYLTTNTSSTLTLKGGNGGSGGNGGDGEGSGQKEIGQAGHGADGGQGGKGGNGMYVVNDLSIDNNGIISMAGGDGGNGGNGGHGGHNTDTTALERADHAGNGGNGGNGGDGGYGLYLEEGSDIRVTENFARVYGGKGGIGGNGNDGGNSTKCEFQTSKGGNPGNAGNGGNGGDGGGSAYNVDTSLYKANPGSGAKGGTKGNPGRNPSIGYGREGTDGTDGIMGQN